MPNAATLHTGTPVLAVIDPRGLPLRSVTYLRDEAAVLPETLVHRLAHDACHRERTRWDPRLWAAANDDAPAALRSIPSLSGTVLRSDSADAGWRVVLLAASGRISTTWDARGNIQWVDRDNLGRPLAVHEHPASGSARCAERFTYARGDGDAHATNRAGRVTRHDDPAGSLHVDAVALGGGIAGQTRAFCASLTPPDWPENVAARDALLEDDRAITHFEYDATGAVQENTDARTNRWRFAHDVAGQACDVWLRSPGSAERQVFGEAHYDAAGRLVSRTAAAGALSTEWIYREDDNRLKACRSQRTVDGALLQDKTYVYDPAGNVLEIRGPQDADTYAYDSLYRLVAAEGTESTQALPGPDLPSWQPWPPTDTVGYTERYTYDTAGNLLSLDHRGAWTMEKRMRVAATSNRSVPWSDKDTDIDAAFDANGNQCTLTGMQLTWNARGQLQETANESPAGSGECYVYDGAGLRARKLSREAQGMFLQETRYLPGLERHTGADPRWVVAATIGDVTVRGLHWDDAPPDGLPNDALRFQLSDHLGSHTLELDEQAQIVSDEWYRPYGETAARTTRDQAEADYKTHRYSGKERDDTGLYYYGYRYYAPALQRWTSPDPAGHADGWNLYAMVKGNPVTFADAMGLWSWADTATVVASTVRAGVVEFVATAASQLTQWAWTEWNSDVADSIASYAFLGVAVVSGAVVAGALTRGAVARHGETQRHTAISAASLVGAAASGGVFYASGIAGSQAIGTMVKMTTSSLMGPVFKRFGPRNDWAKGESPPWSYDIAENSVAAALAAGMARVKTFTPKWVGGGVIPALEKGAVEAGSSLIRMTRYSAKTETQSGFTLEKPGVSKVVAGITTHAVVQPMKTIANTMWLRLGMNEELSAGMSEATSAIIGYWRGNLAFHVKKNLEMPAGGGRMRSNSVSSTHPLLSGSSLPLYSAPHPSLVKVNRRKSV